MLVIISGAPRTGKGRIAEFFFKNMAADVISTDKVRDEVARENAFEGFPIERLYEIPKGYEFDPVDFFFERNSPLRILEKDRIEAQAIWPSLKKNIESTHRKGHVLIAEGVHLLPHLIKGLDIFPSLFISLVRFDKEKVVQSLLTGASHGDWITSFAKKRETVAAAAEFVCQYSSVIQSECEGDMIETFDTADGLHGAIEFIMDWVACNDF